MVNSLQLFPYERAVRLPVRDMSLALKSPDYQDVQILSEVDVKPTIAHIPGSPAVTAVAIDVPPLIDTPSSEAQAQGGNGTPMLGTRRYIAAGCASGEVAIYSWTSTARLPSKLEGTEGADVTVLPCGFQCVACHALHTARITALYFAGGGMKAPTAQEDLMLKKTIASSSSPPVEGSSPVLLSGDAAGTLVACDVITGRHAVALPAFAGGVHVRRRRGVALIAPVSYPLLFQTPKASLGAAKQQLPPRGAGNYVAVVYHSGVLRILDWSARRFLDTARSGESEGQDRFITRLETIGIPAIPGGDTGPDDDRAGGGGVFFFEELSYVPAVTGEQPPEESRTFWYIESSGVERQKALAAAPAYVAVVTTNWLGVVEYRCIADPAVGCALMPYHVAGVDIPEEATSATCVVVERVPIMVVLTSTGSVKAYSVSLSPLTQEVTLRAIMSAGGFPSPCEASVLGKDGTVLITGRAPGTNAPCIYLGTISETMRQRIAQCRRGVWATLRAVCSRQIEAARMHEAGETAPRKKSKGWKSTVLGKLQQWTGEVSKPKAVPAGTLRYFLRTAPRDCMCSARDHRLRGRQVSQVCVERPTLAVSSSTIQLPDDARSAASSGARNTASSYLSQHDWERKLSNASTPSAGGTTASGRSKGHLRGDQPD